MFNSTIELITLAASNSLIIFCFCNLIIVILLLGGSKPTSHFDQHSASPPPTVANRNKINDIKGTSVRSSSDKKNASTSVSEASNVNDEEVNENEEDDELRKRVEDFINKINRGWKAEKLRRSSMVQ
uniref:Putative histone acetyltransferase GCN5-like n=1 Tax=Davidia involucrata TaxID=16924 RepID=A0A5B7BT06_DAVIN